MFPTFETYEEQLIAVTRAAEAYGKAIAAKKVAKFMLNNVKFTPFVNDTIVPKLDPVPEPEQPKAEEPKAEAPKVEEPKPEAKKRGRPKKEEAAPVPAPTPEPAKQVVVEVEQPKVEAKPEPQPEPNPEETEYTREYVQMLMARVHAKLGGNVEARVATVEILKAATGKNSTSSLAGDEFVKAAKALEAKLNG